MDNGNTKQKSYKRLLAFIIALAFLLPGIPMATKEVSAIPSASGATFDAYESDYANRTEMRKAALKTNESIMEEGAVMIKNDDSLPLSKTAKVTILGKNSVNLVYSGSGSSGANAVGSSGTTIYQAFAEAGIEANPYAEAFYKSHQISGIGRPRSPWFGSKPSGIPIGETRAVGDVRYGASYVTSGNSTTSAAGVWGQKNTAPTTDIEYVGGQAESNYDADVTVNGSTKNLRDSFEEYNDAAIVVFSRVGGEGWDLPRIMKMQQLDAGTNNRFPNYSVAAATGVITSEYNQYNDDTNTDLSYAEGANTVIVPGARNWNDHYLQLDVNETNILKEACAYFDNVIVVLNSATPLELGFLDDPGHYAYNEKIKGCLWIGTPGQNGIMAVPRLLNGDVNPSGSLVDTYTRQFLSDPTMFNFANNNAANGNRYTVDGADQGIYFVDYQEDIYLGYRYYETRYAEILKAEGQEAADAWYKQNVIKPFGYSGSYTAFSTDVISWKLDGAVNADNSAVELTGKSEFEITVKVTNIGSEAGKKSIQLYAETPYTPGGIEKAAKVLIGFEKTKLLKPGESQILTAKAPAYYFASFDWDDKNKNEFKGYEIEKGAYKIYAADNAHDSSNAISFTVTADVIIESDPYTGNDVTPQFEYMGKYMQTSSALLSRKDNFTNYNTLTYGNTRKATTAEHIKEFGLLRPSDSSGASAANNPYKFSTAEEAAASLAEIFRLTGAPIITKPYPTTQTATLLSYDEATIKFADMYDVDYDSPLWDAFLDQLTFDQMQVLIGGYTHNTINTNLLGGNGGNNGANWTANTNGITSNRYFSVRIDNIGKPVIMHLDGPVGWSNESSEGEHARTVAGGSSNKYHITQAASQGNPVPALAMASTCLVAASMNKKLQNDVGLILGEDALWAYDHIDASTISGGYAPAANLHRTPFSGRNFEYFSEDGVLSGITMGQMVVGLQDKGVYSFIKHYFLNDQETNRNTAGLATWATEQAMRELYARAFEIAIKAANANNPKLMGIMTAFNRLGYDTNIGCYESLNVLPRHEWGFQGNIITDWVEGNFMYGEFAVIAGNDKMLGRCAPTLSQFALDDPTYGNTYKWSIRNAVKNILFADVNSNAIVHTTAVRTLPINITTANNNADNNGKTFQVGTAVNYSLRTDAADLYKPTVLYGNKAAVTYTYELASGYSLPKGLTLTSDGRIVGKPLETTKDSTGASAAVKVRIDVKATGVNTSYYDGDTYGADAKFDKRGESIVYNTGVQWVTLRVNGTEAAEPYTFGGKMLGTAEIGKYFEASAATAKLSSELAANVAVAYEVKPGYTLPDGITLSTGGKISGVAAGKDIYTASIPVVARFIVTNDNVTIGTQTYNTGDTYDTAEAVFTLQIGAAAGAGIVDEMQTAINAAVDGLLDEATTQALIDAATSGLLNETQVRDIITGYNYITNAALSGYVTETGLKALTDGYGYITNAALSGYVTTAGLKALTDGYGYITNSALTGFLKEADIKAITDGYGYLTGAAIAGFKTEEEIKTIILSYNYITSAAIAGKLDEAAVKELINDAVKNNLTVADIQKMIDDAIKANNDAQGCGSSSAAIVALFSLLACAFIVVVKKQF